MTLGLLSRCLGPFFVLIVMAKYLFMILQLVSVVILIFILISILGKELGSLKGVAGAVRSIQIHPTQPFVATAGLDRFVRIYNYEKRSLAHKVSDKAIYHLNLYSYT